MGSSPCLTVNRSAFPVSNRWMLSFDVGWTTNWAFGASALPQRDSSKSTSWLSSS